MNCENFVPCSLLPTHYSLFPVPFGIVESWVMLWFNQRQAFTISNKFSLILLSVSALESFSKFNKFS
ncbi:MAG: hypothetical protein F6K53_35665, partial [Moorea sp. SIO4A1]|uniref:hypothetical protein n=1 Tax=Moorena sp. SIO4A1 TaxID=2607835 RepID=UPI00144F491D